jgi:hypothetical protein
MMICCCALAGTKACETCPNNSYSKVQEYTYTNITQNELRENSIKRIDEEIARLEAQKKLLQTGSILYNNGK